MSTETPISQSKGPRRRGDDTRRRVEEAAARLFTERGYSATSMQAIADAAGVHVQTIYLAYRTKAAVLAASAARLVAGDEDPATHPSRRTWARTIQAAPGARDKIALYVRHIVDVAPRITPLIDVLRATAPSEPDVAAFLEHMEHARREGPLQLLGPLASSGQLRDTLTPDDVADIVFALASPDTIRALTVRCGWDSDRAAAWLTAALIHELLS
ncbi:MAG TPA: helix-turn-helix domain-containing protein [Solirubrobacter sp.]|nr:helix-turn-helix domain-containing protein [Solirubrobacter sp.]